MKFVVKVSAISGRGLHATEKIEQGELIEESHIIEFCPLVSKHFIETDCGEAFLAWSEDEDGKIQSAAVATGCCMFCNHSKHPNAKLLKDFEKKTVQLVATCDIHEGDEILIKYRELKTFSDP